MTTLRYRIAHQTVLHYDRPASSSHNEVRMTPVNEPGQLTLDSRLRARPITWNATYTDYWGTTVMSLESLAPHEELAIEVLSTVERSDAERLRGHGLTWAELTDDAVVDAQLEFLTRRRRTRLDDAVLAEWTGELECLSPAETVEAVSRRVHEQVRYMPGVTTVNSDAQHTVETRQGVCQDLTHLTITLLRHLGVPARYVSGYVCPIPDLPVGGTAVGESHAWLEWWDGAWLPVDPTNMNPVGLEHVVVARGRDYDDVPPMRGVYQGVGTSTLSVQVEFTRLG
ncbi:MAG: transglutaminase family protein [Propionibacterium sp.]|nr:transglutaminase family protein [Propionibacterium sp.]